MFSSVYAVTMEGYTVEQRVNLIRYYYQKQCSTWLPFCALCNDFPRHRRPTESTIRRLIKRLAKWLGKQAANTRTTAKCKVYWKKIAAVRESVRGNPKQSICHRSQERALSATSMNMEAFAWRHTATSV